MPPDVVQQLDEELALQAGLHDRAVPFFSPRQQNFKWGGCPYHLQSSLQPHVLRSGRFQGHIMLRCSRFWKREEASGRRLCWYCIPCPRGLYDRLPEAIRMEFESLSSAFARGRA